MKRFLVKLIFQIEVETNTNAAEFDEQYRIIEAWDQEAAFLKGRQIGKIEEESFFDVNDKKISWNFIDVADIYALESVKDGKQLFSNTQMVSDAQSFVSFIRQKSMEIQSKSLTFA